MRRRLTWTVLVAAISAAPAPGQSSAVVGSSQATSTIAGVLETDATSPQPIRRAVVTITSAGLPRNRSVVTDDEGRFEFTGLPAGRYLVTATKPAFLPASYGATRQGRPGTPVALSAGARVEIKMRMGRGAVVTGVVRDERGRPLSGVSVSAVDVRPGARGSASETDDRGIYRIFGIEPGSVVVSVLRGPSNGGGAIARSAAEMDALLDRLARNGPGSAPSRPAITPAVQDPARVALTRIYYPGTLSLSEATKLTLSPGDERTNVDITVRSFPVFEVSGIVTDDRPLANVSLTLASADDPSPISISQRTTSVGSDGRFRFTGVPPDRYVLKATSQLQVNPARGSGGGGVGAGVGPAASSAANPLLRDPREGWHHATNDIVVATSDVSGITVALQPGVTLSGRVEVDAAPAGRPIDLTKVTIGVEPSTLSRQVFLAPTLAASLSPRVAVRADGSFELTGLGPGLFFIRAYLPADSSSDWWLRTAVGDGRDLLDAPIEIRVGRNVAGVVATLTNRHSELRGTLTNTAGVPAAEYFIVAIPADRGLWLPSSRRYRFTRPGTDGAFSITDLPAGEYLVNALTDFEPADMADQTFVEGLATAGVKVTIADGRQTVQNFQLAR